MTRPLMLLLAAGTLTAQPHDLGLTLGRIAGPDRTLTAPNSGTLKQGNGTALQANYAYRLVRGNRASVYFQTHLLANGQRAFQSPAPSATTDVATLYVTPGFRIKFLPDGFVSPWAEVGGGYALYEQSKLRVDGAPNDAPRFLHRGAFEFGGGLDTKLIRRASVRNSRLLQREPRIQRARQRFGAAQPRNRRRLRIELW